ncbi:hypothetical protein PR048_004754 [Dryococelus australis]|uniref:PiggyBac transposable element-derived protein domain-containing protein n=1 Tax=Dryococelus australis TaxID=614101 RepID=A0ABQ9I690_9NEOP|nr:hypothetical protein PR048_004754 [Dryococelus australis]
MASSSMSSSMKADDPHFEEWVQGVLKELESDFSGDEDDNIAADCENEHDTTSEQEIDSEEEDVVRSQSESEGITSEEDSGSPARKRTKEGPKFSLGKNMFKWSSQSPCLGTHCSHLSAWELLFTEEVLTEVILRTNEKLSEVRQRLSDENRNDYRDIDIVEFKAFLGILMFSSDIFCCTMSLKRVHVILLFIRFDNLSDREGRKKTDPTAAINQVFEEFVKNCRACYCIGEYACIDEMLVGFRGQCRMKAYIPSKPRKEEKSAMYGFTSDLTLVSFVTKKNKAVILVSSMHHTKDTDPSSSKPDIIEFYNTTKGGVDAIDEKCILYSTSRRTRSSPLAICYAVLNISLVNSYVLFCAFPENPRQSRLEFVKALAKELVGPQLNARMLNGHLPHELRLSIGRILKENACPENPPQLDRQMRWDKCPRTNEKKTKLICTDCKTPICGNCTVRLCTDCSL